MELRMRSAVQSDVRKINSRMLYDLFRTHRMLTRAEVALKLNMTIPSVLKVTQQLKDKNVINEIGEADTAIGRKPKQFEFNPDFLNAIGVSFEGVSMSMGLVNVDGDIRFSTEIHLQGGMDESFVNAIINGVEKIKCQSYTGNLSGIGIAIPGIVNPNTCMVEFAPLINIFEPFDATSIVDKISNRLGLQVSIENDVNMFAKGEFYARGLGPNDDLVCITLGTGIGCGILLDGKLRRGRHHYSGEIGYFVSDVKNVTLKDSEGYLESLINLKALEKKFPNYASATQDVKALIPYISSHLSPHIANIVTLLDIDIVVLGGIVVNRCGDSLIESVKHDVNKLTLSNIKVESSVSRDPGVVGSAAMIMERVVGDYI